MNKNTLIQEDLFSDIMPALKNYFLISHNGYKRYLGSPLRYAGGKSLAVGYILEYLHDDIDKVISPFIGGGILEVRVHYATI